MSPVAAGWFRVGVGFISDSWGSAIQGSWGAFPRSWDLTPDSGPSHSFGLYPYSENFLSYDYR